MALALRNKRQYHGCEIVVERDDGSRRTGLAHASPVWDEDGRLLGAVNILVDITEQKRLENALREADRQKDQFLAMLAHELRNPLAPILNAAQILELQASDESVVRRQGETIDRNGRHLCRMVDDLLEVSRINEGKIELRKERVELAGLIEQAVESVQPHILEREHSLSVSIPRQQIYLDADPMRLTQILVNLLDNAAKYTDPGGRITLTAAHHGPEVVLSVRDNGRGITPEHAATIFELFVQVDRTLARSEGGLGIGLTLVKRMVELHDGSIAVHSAGRGRGSEFTVRLPAEPAPSSAQMDRRSVVSTANVPQSKRILLVEDNVDGAETLAELLDLWGHEVRVLHDGAMALEMVGDYQPQVILLDIGLPGMDGFTVAARLRELPGVRSLLIGLTGYGDPDHVLKAREAGFHEYVVKPVDPERLRELLAGTAPA